MISRAGRPAQAQERARASEKRGEWCELEAVESLGGNEGAFEGDLGLWRYAALGTGSCLQPTSADLEAAWGEVEFTEWNRGRRRNWTCIGFDVEPYSAGAGVFEQRRVGGQSWVSQNPGNEYALRVASRTICQCRILPLIPLISWRSVLGTPCARAGGSGVRAMGLDAPAFYSMHLDLINALTGRLWHSNRVSVLVAPNVACSFFARPERRLQTTFVRVDLVAWGGKLVVIFRHRRGQCGRTRYCLLVGLEVCFS